MYVLLSPTSTQYIDLMAQMFRQRKKIFADMLRYQTTTWSGPISGESDAFDNKLTRYLLYAPNRQVHAFVRFHPTHGPPYMIMREWAAHLNVRPPQSPRIVEGSRLAISSGLEGSARRNALEALLCGMYTYCYQRGIEQILGAMLTPIWERVFAQRGLPITFLSDEFQTNGLEEGEPTRVGFNTVSDSVLKRLCSNAQINDCVGPLNGPPSLPFPARL